MKQPWEQMDGEPDAGYAHFLVYRNMGPGRTYDRAARSVDARKRKRKQAPGNWTAEAAQWKWHERAIQWDINFLTTEGTEAVLAFVTAIKRFAQHLAAKLDTLHPKNWAEAAEALQILATYIPQGAVERIVQRPAEPGHPAINGAANGQTQGISHAPD